MRHASRVIRQGTPGDLRAVHQLEKACFGRRAFSRDHVARILRDPSSVTYITMEDGHLVASIMVRLEGEIARVLSVGVHPRYRNRGMGRDLMGLGEAEAIKRGAQEMALEVSVNNSGAIEFYKLLGYGIRGVLHHYYSWGEDAYLMTKALAPAPSQNV